MRKNFKNIENDEEFKNFRIEDYLPSMNTKKQEVAPLMQEEETAATEEEEETVLLPPLDKSDTSEVQAVIADEIAPTAVENMETGAS